MTREVAINEVETSGCVTEMTTAAGGGFSAMVVEATVAAELLDEGRCNMVWCLPPHVLHVLRLPHSRTR